MNKKWLKNKHVQQLIPWVVPILLIVVWQLLVQVGWLSTRVLPAPTSVLQAFFKLAKSGELFRHIGVSTWRAFIGFLIGGGIGLALGFLNGIFPIAERLLDTSVQMLRNIPHLALIPLVILWFGIGEEAKLFLVALGVMFPMYLNTFHGIRTVDPGLIEMGKVYGLKPTALFWQIIIPGALPSILVGLRYSLGIMWLTLIVAETIASDSGASTRERQGMWANSNFSDLVQYNDGFKTGLIGTAEQVAERIREYYEVGVDLILCGFLHYTDDLPAFGRTVIPLVRELEARRPRSAEVLVVA